MTGHSEASNMVARGSTLALAALLIAGPSVQALAQTPPNPAANQVWGGCVLTDGTGDDETNAVAGLEASVAAGAGIGTPDIAFVVVYSLKNDNDGQPVGSDFTGPVICRNPGVVDPLVTTSETEDIGEEGDTVTILDAEEAFLLQYKFDNAPSDTEKRFCHTVNSETDCFFIRPASD